MLVNRLREFVSMKFIALCTLAVWFLAAPVQAGVYEGQIDGDFNGWEGETIYRLMDGHIIQQEEYHYHYHYAYSPRVIIYQSGDGYKIHVENDNGGDVRIIILR